MSALPVDHDTPFEQHHGYGWDDLVRLWEETDSREGSTVEIVEGIVTVTPPPTGQHNSVAWKVQRQLVFALPEELGIYQTQGIALPSRQSLYVPDLLVAPDAVVGESGPYIPAAAAELVVEITSRANASHDRLNKLEGYGKAGIPLYLLIDGHARGGPTLTLYGEPNRGVYRVLHAGKWGESVHLPEPLGLSLDTSGFPAR